MMDLASLSPMDYRLWHYSLATFDYQLTTDDTLRLFVWIAF